MFGFRIDIDSRYGLLHGVPRLLEVLRRQDIAASFFIPMGGESSVAELLRYRGGERGAMGGVKLPKAELARMVLFPKNFAEENVELLRQILSEGHTLGVHGWKHRAWTRALERIDVGKHVLLATEKYEELFGKKPLSFAAPAFKSSRKVLDALEGNGYRVAGDLDGNDAFFPIVDGRKYSCCQVPVTLKQENTDPLIESFSLQGASDDAVAQKICGLVDGKEMQGSLATLYCHDFFEGVHKPHVVESVLAHVKKEGYAHNTMEEIGLRCKSSKKVEL